MKAGLFFTILFSFLKTFLSIRRFRQFIEISIEEFDKNLIFGGRTKAGILKCVGGGGGGEG